MARTRPSTATSGDWEDDELYRGVLVSAKIEKSKNPQYPDDQLKVEWEGRQGAKVTDYLGIKLGIGANGPSKLRQLLNGIAEKDKLDEVWFDADTLEWGYDLDGDDSTPAFAQLRPGLVVQFRGENKPSSKGEGTYYKITGYKGPGKVKKNGQG